MKGKEEKDGEITGEERAEATDGEITIGGDDGVEVGGVVQLGEATTGCGRVRRGHGQRSAAERRGSGHRQCSERSVWGWQLGAGGEGRERRRSVTVGS